MPDDISVVGCDDRDLAPYSDLTTVRQDVTGIGIEAATKLAHLIRNEPVEGCTILPTQLLLRGTTAKAGAGLKRIRMWGVQLDDSVLVRKATRYRLGVVRV